MKQDESAIDLYTFAHLGFGIGAKQLGMSTNQILIIAVAYEILEPSIIKYMRESLNINAWGYESKSNIVVDVLAAYVGAKIGEKI